MAPQEACNKGIDDASVGFMGIQTRFDIRILPRALDVQYEFQKSLEAWPSTASSNRDLQSEIFDEPMGSYSSSMPRPAETLKHSSHVQSRHISALPSIHVPVCVAPAVVLGARTSF